VLGAYRREKPGKSNASLEELVGVLTPTLLPTLKKFYCTGAVAVVGRGLKGPKKIYHHKFVTSDVYPFYDNQTKIFRWPRDIIKDGKLPDSIKEALPIKTSSSCRYVGNVGMTVGSRIQKFNQIDPYWRKSDFRWFLSKVDEFSEYRITAKGAWPTQVNNFQELCDPAPEIDIDDYWACAQKRLHKIKLPKITVDITEDYVLGVGTKANSYAGLLCESRGLKTHYGADSFIKPIAARVFREASEEMIVDRSCWTIGGRGRSNKIELGNIGAEIKSRVVLMPEGVSKIIALAISGPWMRQIAKINKEAPWNEIGVGIDFMNGKFGEFARVFDPYDIQFEVDWKGFDTKVTENLLVLAFAILRGCFPAGKKYDNLFFFMASGTIFKNVVIPGGFCFRLSKCLPSGSPWTTALGCIINWLCWAKILEGFENSSHIICYGDDSKGGLINLLGYNIFDKIWFEERIRETPMIGKGLAIFDRFDNPSPYTGPTLLKAYSCAGLPARRQIDFYETLVYGGGSGLRHSRNAIDMYEKTKGALYNNPFSLHTMPVLRRLLIQMYMVAWGPHRSGMTNDQLYAEARKKVANSERIAYNRYVLPRYFETPKNKISLPWLDAQKFYCNSFYAGPDFDSMFELFVSYDIESKDRNTDLGTVLADGDFRYSIMNLKQGPPRRLKIRKKKPPDLLIPYLDAYDSLDAWMLALHTYWKKRGAYVDANIAYIDHVYGIEASDSMFNYIGESGEDNFSYVEGLPAFLDSLFDDEE